MSDRPAFEITDLSGKTFRIWSNGRIEGFEGMSPCVVINRIPAEIAEAIGFAVDVVRRENAQEG